MIRNIDENTLYMRVAQNDETNPDTQPVRPPHIPSIVNTQLFPFGPPVRKRETPGILSRMFPPFAGITYPYVRSPLAQRVSMLCFVMLDCSVIYYVPLRYFFPVNPEAAVGTLVIDYIDDEPFLPEQPGKPPLITSYRLFFSILLALE